MSLSKTAVKQGTGNARVTVAIMVIDNEVKKLFSRRTNVNLTVLKFFFSGADAYSKFISLF